MKSHPRPWEKGAGRRGGRNKRVSESVSEILSLVLSLQQRVSLASPTVDSQSDK